MQDFVANLRRKPEHVRRRIALGSSAGFTALVALIWVTTLATTGSFAITDPSKQEANEDAYVLGGTGVQSNFSQLMGAVGAAAGATTSKPNLTVIDGETSSTFNNRQTGPDPDATVIPF